MNTTFPQLFIDSFNPDNFFANSVKISELHKRLFSDCVSSISSRCNESDFEESLKRPKNESDLSRQDIENKNFLTPLRKAENQSSNGI